MSYPPERLAGLSLWALVYHTEDGYRWYEAEIDGDVGDEFEDHIGDQRFRWVRLSTITLDGVTRSRYRTVSEL